MRGAAGAAGAAGAQGAAGGARPKGDAGARGDTGGRGDTGDAGQRGATGPVGPLYGRSSTGFSIDTPGAPYKYGSNMLNVVLPAAGRLQVFGHIDSDLYCTAAGPCSIQWGIYIDDVPVPGTGGPVVAAAANGLVNNDYVALAGLSPVVPAGAHTVVLGFFERTGHYSSASYFGSGLNAVLVGPS